MGSRSTMWLWLAILSLFASCLASMPTCYYPDGTATGEQGEYLPCNKTSSSGHSACCYYYDGCTTTGLCVGHGGVYYVGGCTDPSFKSPECPQICNGPKHGGWTEILDCPDGGSGTNPGTGSWCCSHIGWNNGSCCKAGQTFGMSLSSWGHVYAPYYFLRDFVTSTSKGAAKSTSTKNSQGSHTGVSSSTSDNNQPQPSSTSSNSDLGTKVGLAVGIPLGVLVAAAIGFCVWREMRKSKQSTKAPEHWPSEEPKYRDQAQSPHYGSNPAVSPQSPMQGGYPQVELEGQHVPQELANHPSMKR